MKRNNTILLTILSLSFFLVISGCKSEADQHMHTFSTIWSYDADSHWYAATCEHSEEVSNQSAHSFSNFTSNNDATTEADGTKSRFCEICNYEDKVTDEGTKIHVHTFGEWIVTTSATEESTGLKERACSGCDFKEIEVIAKLVHTHVLGTKYEAILGNCTEPGTVEYYECTKSSCTVKLNTDGNELSSVQGAVNPDNHKGTATTWTKTETTHKETWNCCGTEKVVETAHSFSNFTSNNDATTEADGTKSRFCEICNYEDKVTDEGTKIHIHTFSDELSADAMFHFYAATCEHTDKVKNREMHLFGAYVFNNDGSNTKTKTCEICNYKNTITTIKGSFEGTSLQTQGEVFDNLTLNENKIDKTSMVIVIPEGMTAIINDTEYNNISDVFSSYRKVTLSSYAIGQYEVTRELFKAVMGYIPSKASKVVGNKSNGPVSGVHFFESIIFCNKLSILNNLEPVYSYTIDGEKITDPDIWIDRMGAIKDTNSNSSIFSKWAAGLIIDISKNGYRLPTEAEWEFAARGGNPTVLEWDYTYSGSNTLNDVACREWLAVAVVGSKAANRLGLYDMSGNVSEMCNDTLKNSFTDRIVTNPLYRGINDIEYKIVRGGSGMSDSNSLKTKVRSYNNVKDTIDSLAGFRLARTLNTDSSK